MRISDWSSDVCSSDLVALPAADRQLGGDVFEQRVGDAEVALGVLEVDRLDLVRHGRAADIAGLDRLLEVAQRDIAPDVAAQVDRTGVDPARSDELRVGKECVRTCRYLWSPSH